VYNVHRVRCAVCVLGVFAACGGDGAARPSSHADKHAQTDQRDASTSEAASRASMQDDADASANAAQPEASTSATDPRLQSLLDWVLAKLNRGDALSDAEIDQYFSPVFLAQIPRDELILVFSQLAGGLPPISVAAQQVTSSLMLEVRLATAMGPWLLTLNASSGEPTQITGLVVTPISTTPPPTTYRQAVEQLQPMAANTQLLVAEIKGTECATRQSENADARLAIGSAFKLWVLYTLDLTLSADPSLSWDTTLRIRDALKSVPSGMLQDQPDGTELTLREFASDMISISDNTAADHLIEYVGRSAVEASQKDTKHSDPAANTPWLKTRELTALKAWASADQVAAYRAADLADKRKLLDQLEALPIDLDQLAAWTTPRALDLEWFGSANDLCNVLAALGARAQFDPSSELLRILSINPGVAFDPAQWQYVGYKGGSELGVLNLSWLLRRSDGRWFSIVITLNDPDHGIDENAAAIVAAGVAQILSADPN
jgi:beta-lactamase class A